MITVTLEKLGIPTFKPEELHWRRSYLSEVKSGKLVGRRFKTTKGKEFICLSIDEEYIYFLNIRMERRFALFYLPTIKPYTTKEQIELISNKYPNSDLYIGKGCQLHGNIDATLTLENGTIYKIPWNY